MNAICAPWRSSVALRCTSATKLPSVDSPPRFSLPSVWTARRMSTSVSPITWAPRTSASATAAETVAATSASGAKVPSTSEMFSAVAPTVPSAATVSCR